jgi:selenocysteine lyase/cysteine desulfurase
VRRENYRFLQEPEFREEGGTPAIVESIRAGLVFQLKNAVSAQKIMEKEAHFHRYKSFPLHFVVVRAIWTVGIDRAW